MKSAILIAIILIFPIVGNNYIGIDSKMVRVEDTEYSHDVDNLKYLYTYGFPILPCYIKTYEFPVGTTINKIEVIAEEITKEKAKEIKICPFPITAIKINREKEEFKNEFYPKNWYDYHIRVGIKNMERMLFLSIHIYPMRYNPISKEILHATQIKIKIDYTPPYKPLFTNDEYDLLIICPSQWKEELEKLREHKEQHGIRTIIVTLDEIDTQGRDDAEKIKYYIKKAIEEYGIKYVMLVGGRQGGVRNERWLMPVRYAHLDDGGEKRFLSDLYFADIYKYEDGEIKFEDWDSNGNGIYGEWKTFAKDEIDLMPDVYVGRLACRNKMEVKIMVDKIISYENSNNKDWFKRMVVVGGDSWPNKDDPYYEGEEENKLALQYMQDFQGIKLWTSLGTLTGPSDVIREVNKGCGFLFFDGHGNPMSWATHPPHDEETWIGGLIVSDIPKLKNKDMYPVCVVGGCHNSQFNVSVFNLLKIRKLYETYYKSEWSPECWSWWLTRKIDGGAIATIGYTGYDYFAIKDEDGDGIPDCVQYYSGFLNVNFFKEYGMDGVDILGIAWANTISRYILTHDVDRDIIDCKTVEEWVLLGDPSLKIGGY